MDNQNNTNPIVGKECVFVTHLPAIENVRDDTHLVKEIVHFADGKIERRLRVLKNFRRPFWITKEHYQNHKQKKESESLEKVNEFSSTQSDLIKNIASRLGSKYVGKPDYRRVSDNPYVYGMDVSAKTMIKHAYLTRYPNLVTPLTVATLDIETDTDTATNEIVIISLTMADKVFTVFRKDIIKNDLNVYSQLHHLFKKHIPVTPITENINVEYKMVDLEIELVLEVLKKAHEWGPDIIAVWNIVFDMQCMLKACDKYGVDPKDVFSDPNLPKPLRHFNFKLGQQQRVTEKGVYKSLSPEEQWHVVTCSSKSYWIDAMSTHRYVRVGGKTIPGGYSLDNVLQHELGKEFKKLKFESNDTVNVVGIDWHKYMLKNKTLEYIIYNQWDTMSMIEMDNKTKDLCTNISILSGPSSFDIFNSGPKRIVDALHFFYLLNKKVLGCKSAMLVDDKLLGLGSWISILPAHRVKDNGLKVIAEDSEMTTNSRGHVGDADQVSGYPSNGQAANVSRETTSRELLSIEGIEKETFRLQNINLFFGPINNIEYCTEMLNFIPLTDMLEKSEAYL